MESLNDFIQAHIEDAYHYFDRLSAAPKEAQVSVVPEIPTNVYENALLFLVKHIHTIQTRIDRGLNEVISITS